MRKNVKPSNMSWMEFKLRNVVYYSLYQYARNQNLIYNKNIVSIILLIYYF